MTSKYILEDEKALDNTFSPSDLPSHSPQPKQTLKQARLSAYNKMGHKGNKTFNTSINSAANNKSIKTISKEEVQLLSKQIPKNESLINSNYIGQGNSIETVTNPSLPIPSPFPLKNNFDMSNLSSINHINYDSNHLTNPKDLIGQYQQYYDDKLSVNPSQQYPNNNNNTGPSFQSNNQYEQIIEPTPQSSLHLAYSFGMLNNVPNSFCYHKTEKWFAYITHNNIIIEDLSHEFNRKQEILSFSQEPLSHIKLSPNNKILYAYANLPIQRDRSISNPFILFYAYKKEYQKNFVLINSCSFNQNEIVSCEICPRNNLSIILTRCKGSGSFISVLDFYNNEILVTTGMNEVYKAIKWNCYLTNLEFCTISDTILTFWRINSSDGALQYQHGSIDYDKYFEENKNIIMSLEFIPPIDNNVILLLGDSNGKVYAIDTRTNCLLIQWDIFKYNSNFKEISFILSNKAHIAFICDNEIKSYKIDYSKIKKVNELFNGTQDSLLSNDQSLKFDSKIISFDHDYTNCNDTVVLSQNGILYYIDYEENCSIKLFHFLSKKNKVLQVAIMKKTYDKYEIVSGNNPYENPEPENEAHNLQNIQENYYLITSHEGGAIKIWSIPEYILLYNYETVNEEILCFNNAMNDLLFAVSYTNTTIRFFTNEKLLGKFSAKHLSSFASFNYIKFLPDSKFLFLIDTSNTLYLIHIEKYEPLLIQFHQVFKAEHNIVDFQLSMVEYYNKFLFNLQNVFLCVYNRKFTNIMKNLSYENSIPQFYIQDKFNINEYFRNNHSTPTHFNRPQVKNEKYTCSFSPNFSEKNFIYLLSKATHKLIIRNFETHVIENIIQLSDSIDTFAISNNFKFFIFLYTKKIQISSIADLLKRQKEGNDTMIIENISKNELPLITYPKDYHIISSDNSRIAIAYSNSFIFVYKL